MVPRPPIKFSSSRTIFSCRVVSGCCGMVTSLSGGLRLPDKWRPLTSIAGAVIARYSRGRS